MLIDRDLRAVEDFSEWFEATRTSVARDFADEMKPLGKTLLLAAGDALGIT